MKKLAKMMFFAIVIVTIGTLFSCQEDRDETWWSMPNNGNIVNPPDTTNHNTNPCNWVYAPRDLEFIGSTALGNDVWKYEFRVHIGNSQKIPCFNNLYVVRTVSGVPTFGNTTGNADYSLTRNNDWVYVTVKVAGDNTESWNVTVEQGSGVAVWFVARGVYRKDPTKLIDDYVTNFYFIRFNRGTISHG